jgi:TPR repeat protein
MLVLAQLHHRGQMGYDRSVDKAATLYRRAAEGGCVPAMRAMGDLYGMGDGPVRDTEQMMAWYLRACDAGDTNLMLDVARFYMGGLGDIEQDIAAAHKWYEAGALRGSGYARLDAARAFARPGQGQDLIKARKWYGKAIESGEADAIAPLAAMLLRGEGGPADIPRGLEMLKRRAGEDRDGPAMYELGRAYEAGLGVPVDAEAARGWYAKGSDNYHRASRTAYGRMLVRGLGGEADVDAGLAMLTEEANQRTFGACIELARLYDEGVGVARDWTVAWQWYGKAQQIDPDALERLGWEPARRPQMP